MPHSFLHLGFTFTNYTEHLFLKFIHNLQREKKQSVIYRNGTVQHNTVEFHDAYQARFTSPSSDGAGSISEVRTMWRIKFQIIGWGFISISDPDMICIVLLFFYKITETNLHITKTQVLSNVWSNAKLVVFAN